MRRMAPARQRGSLRVLEDDAAHGACAAGHAGDDEIPGSHQSLVPGGVRSGGWLGGGRVEGADAIQGRGQALAVQHHRIEFEQGDAFAFEAFCGPPQALEEGQQLRLVRERLGAALAAQPGAAQPVFPQIREGLFRRAEGQGPDHGRGQGGPGVGLEAPDAADDQPARVGIALEGDQGLRGQARQALEGHLLADQPADPRMFGHTHPHGGGFGLQGRFIEGAEVDGALVRLVPELVRDALEHDGLAGREGQGPCFEKPVARHPQARGGQQAVGPPLVEESRGRVHVRLPLGRGSGRGRPRRPRGSSR